MSREGGSPTELRPEMKTALQALAESKTPDMCLWFLMCRNVATTTRTGPIGGGRFGEIPCCDRCAER